MNRLRKQLADRLPPDDGAQLRVYLCGLLRVVAADGREITIPSIRGRALLAYLCLLPDGQASRREIARHLWPEPDANTATAGNRATRPIVGCAKPSPFDEPRLKNLREELKKLRFALGDIADRVVSATREAIAIDLRLVWTDHRDQIVSIIDGKLPPLMRDTESNRLLAGATPLMTKFDAWLDEQRDEFRALKRTVLTDRARMLEQQNLPLTDLVAEHRRLFDYDPADESNCRKLMRLLSRMGATAEARRAYQRCKTAVEQEMEAGLEPETEALYLSIGVATSPSAQPSGSTVALPALLRGTSIAPGIAVRLPHPDQPSIRLDDCITVGIRPVRNLTGAPELDATANSIFDDLLTDLAMFVRPFAIVPLAAANQPAAAAEATCRFIIELSLKRGDQRNVATLRLNVHIYDRLSARLVRATRTEIDATSVLADSRQLTYRTASKILTTLVTEQTERLLTTPHDRRSAADLVVLGMSKLRSANTPENLMSALTHFEGALRLHNTSVDALANSAHVYHRLATQPAFSPAPAIAMRKGRAFADEALDIDPLHPKATYVSAMLNSTEGRPERAAAEFDRLLEVTTNGAALSYRGYNRLFLDQPTDGLEDIRQSTSKMRDDPSLPIWLFFEGVAQFHCGDRAGTLASLRKSLLADPRYSSSMVWLAGSEYLDGNQRQAAALIERFRTMSPAYNMSQFDTTWGSARTHNAAYLSRTQVMADALRALGVPER